jgi:hypothetical protein
MTEEEELVVASRVEGAENRIRAHHNELESRRFFGSKNYMPYDSSRFIALVKGVQRLISNHKEEA